MEFILFDPLCKRAGLNAACGHAATSCEIYMEIEYAQRISKRNNTRPCFTFSLIPRCQQAGGKPHSVKNTILS